MSEELLPETFDPEFFGALNIALDEIRATSGGPARAPQGFARGGIASLGRNGDTMLAHVTPAEMRMLKDKGGAGTINPRTGLPEFFSLKKVFSKIGRAVKKFARSTIGKIVVGTALFFLAGPAATSMFGSFGTAAVAAGQGFIAGAGSSLLAGESLKDSLKTGAIGAVTAGAVKGVSNALGGGAEAATTGGAKVVDTSDLVTDTVTETLTSPTGLETTSLTDQLTLGTPTTSGRAVPDIAGKITRQNLMPSAVDTSALTGAPLPANPVADILRSNATAGGIETVMPSQFKAPLNFTNTTSVNPATSVAGSLPTEAPGFFESMKGAVTPDRTLAERGTSLKEAFLPGKGPSLKEVMGANPGMPYDTAQALVADAATGLGRRYLPLAAAGVGVMGLAGGFDTPESEMPDGYGGFMDSPGQRLLDQYPERYALNFGGVKPMGSSGYTTYTPAPYVPPTYNAAQGSGPSGVAQEFPRMNGPIDGPGTGTSDDVPAMLSDGEFVFTAKAVRNMGNGSRRKGAKKMYALMKKLEGTA
jgi:hypothetical protein